MSNLYPSNLSAYAGEDGELTLEKCYYHCVSFKSIWFLVSKGNECVCADTFDGTDADTCDIACEGDGMEKCGGADASEAYLLTAWVPEIEVKPCGVPSALPHTQSMCSGGGGDLPSTCNITCSVGFLLKENAMLCDGSTGEWFGHAFCQEILCGLPQPIPNSVRVCNGASALSPDCEVTCMPGFNLITNTLKCEQAGPESAQGFFAGEVLCEPQTCGLPPGVEYALYNGDTKALYPSITEYSCMKGFTADGTVTGMTNFIINCQEDGTFTTLPAKCMPIECGIPPILPNALSAVSEPAFFSSATEYVCDEGYFVGGLSTGPKSVFMDCTATGEFAPVEPCEPVICGLAPELPFTSTDHDPTALLTFGQAVSFTCSPGYSLDPKDKSKTGFVATCGPIGQFEGVAPCLPVACPKAGFVDHALVADGDLVYLSMADYECAEGHSIDGTVEGNRSFAIECLADGTLAPPGVCLPIACPPPPTAPHRTLHTDAEHVFGFSVTYACDEGFSTDATESEGAKTFIAACLATGEYAETAPCIEIDDCAGHSCGPDGVCVDEHMGYHCECNDGFEVVTDEGTGEPTCGNIDDCGDCGVGTCEDLINDFTCHCPSGYELVTDPEKTCGPVLCGDPPQLTLATRPDGKAFYLDIVHFACELGTSVGGTPVGAVTFAIGCGADKAFFDEQECAKVACPPPLAIAFAEASVPSAVFNDTVKYTCGSGHTVDGTAAGPTDFEVACLAGGVYGAPAACLPVECGSPPPVMGGAVDMTPLFFEETTVYACEEGHSTDGTAAEAALTFTVECGADGLFSGLAECQPIKCEAPPHKEKAYPSVSDVLVYPLAVEYLCDEGYTIDGELTGPNKFHMSCGPTGSFIGDVETTCLPVSCGVIEVMNSKPEQFDPVIFPNTLKYECEHGFAVEMVASDTTHVSPEDAATSFELTCLANGELTPPPLCKNIDDCHGHSCGAHGTCVDEIGDFTCDCMEGFELNVMDDGEKKCGNIDDCKDHQCGSYGVCVDFTGGYTCQCVEGYVLKEVDEKHKTCSPQNCGSLPEIDKATHSGPASLVFPEVALFVCETGYSTDGTVSPEAQEFQVSCGATGEFTPPAACHPVVCGVAPAISYAHTDVEPLEGQTFGAALTYTCEDGYELAGGDTSLTIDCTSDGLFTENMGCMPKSCGTPPAVEMASTVAEVFYPAVATYECASGFSVDGGPEALVFEVACQSDGTFAPLPELAGGGCQPIKCGPPPHVKNARYEENLLTAGEAVEYVCDEGHTTTGTAAGLVSFSSMCQPTGLFDPLVTSECALITYLVQGQVKDATSNAAVPGVKITAVQDLGGRETRTEVEADSSGVFAINLAMGGATLETSKEGYIGASKPLPLVNGPIGVGSGADISVSPILPANGWRMVLKWDEKPFDLDSHVFYGAGGTSCHMFWARTKSYCFNGINAILDVDDTNGYGPETTTLENVASGCEGDSCLLNFVIHNYSRSPDFITGNCIVTLYNGDREVRKFKAGVDGAIDGDMWGVFTLDGRTGELLPDPGSALTALHHHHFKGKVGHKKF
jgi:hypothetical protein